MPTLRALISASPDDPATAASGSPRFASGWPRQKARFDAGSWKETLKQAPALISQARTLGYQPLLAETLGLTGLMYYTANDGLASEKALVEAYQSQTLLATMKSERKPQ